MIDLSDIIIGTAYAQTGAPGGAGGGIGSFIPLILIFFIFYFLLIRPQQKKLKEHQQMVADIKRNDKVVTAGGIVGTVSKVNDDNETINVKIATDVEVSVIKATVTDIVNRTSDAKDSKAEKSENKKKNKR